MEHSVKTPTTRLLSNASRELRSLRIMIERLEAAAYVVITNPEGDHSREIQEIQQLDHLMQTIMNIADFIDSVKQTIPDDIDIEEQEALKAINLQALAERLRSATPENSTPHKSQADDDSGDCSWF